MVVQIRQVCRLRGLTADQIAAELGVPSLKFVWNYGRSALALLDADLPTPMVALGTTRKFRSILKSAGLPSAARRYLEANLAELERRRTTRPRGWSRCSGRRSRPSRPSAQRDRHLRVRAEAKAPTKPPDRWLGCHQPA